MGAVPNRRDWEMAPNLPTARLCASASPRQSGSLLREPPRGRASSTSEREARCGTRGTTTATAESQRRRGRRGSCLTGGCCSQKKGLGNGSEPPDSTPLRLCVSATKRFAVRGSRFAYRGALEERQRPLLCRRDAEAQRLVTDGLVRFPQQELGEWSRTGRQHASAPPAPLRPLASASLLE